MNPCKTGKIIFDTWQQAHKMASHARRNEDGRCTIYRCDFCGKWHLGRRFGKTVGGKRPVVIDDERIEA